jgi:hypothetical protein
MTSMQLTSNEILAVSNALLAYSHSNGARILGAKLGVLINSAIRPKKAKEFGGLGELIRNDLSGLISNPEKHPGSLDYTYEITTCEDLLPSADEIVAVSTNVRTISEVGSNNIIIDAVPSEEELRELIIKLNPEDFANTVTSVTKEASQPSKSLTERLNQVISNSQNPEDKRSEWNKEVQNLYFRKYSATQRDKNNGAATIKQNGIESAAQKIPKITHPGSGVVRVPRPANFTHKSLSIDEFRAFLKEAIDMMDWKELRAICIPVGIAIDAYTSADIKYKK